MILKSVDNSLGRFLIFLLPKRSSSLPPAELKNILVIRPGGIGDAVLLIPALIALRKTFPDSSITVLAEKRNAAVFELTDVVTNVLLYHRPADLCSVLKGRFDIIVDTEQWHRLSAVVTRLVHPTISVGFATNERKKLFTHTSDYAQSDHETLSFLRLFEPLMGGISPELEGPFLTVPEKSLEQCQKLLGPLAAFPYVVVFPGATVAEKRWNVKRYGELVIMLNSRGVRVVAIGGLKDADAAAEIIRDAADINLAGKTTLVESAAIIQGANVLITGDSGVMHLAYGLGTPSVSLFGPSNVQKWAPRGKNHITIHRALPCSPCSRFGYTPPCPSGVACMAEISVTEVAEAVFSLLQG